MYFVVFRRVVWNESEQLAGIPFCGLERSETRIQAASVTSSKGARSELSVDGQMSAHRAVGCGAKDVVDARAKSWS